MEAPPEGLSVGRSLWPVLAGGRRLAPVSRRPRVGEVAVYRVGPAVRAHRVLARSGQSLLVRGDHPAVPLERVPLDEVVGVWAPEGARLAVALGAATGRAIGAAALLAGRPPVLAAARWVSAHTPGTPAPAATVTLAREPAEALAVTLGELGLLRPLRSVDEVRRALLAGTGFAVLARRGRATVAALRALPADGGLRLRLATARRDPGAGLRGRLLDAAVAEARDRAIPRLLADLRRDDDAGLRCFAAAGFTRLAEAVLVSPGDGVRLDRHALVLR